MKAEVTIKFVADDRKQIDNLLDTLAGNAAEPTAPPAPPAAEPTAPPATPAAEPTATTTPANVELDAAGYPWDARIHMQSRKKVQKTGEWKLIREIEKTSPGLVDAVRKEWRDGMASTEAVPPAAGQTAPPAPPADEPKLLFPSFINMLTKNGFDREMTQPFLDEHGVADLPALAAKPDLIGRIAKAMGIWDGSAQ